MAGYQLSVGPVVGCILHTNPVRELRQSSTGNASMVRSPCSCISGCSCIPGLTAVATCWRVYVKLYLPSRTLLFPEASNCPCYTVKTAQQLEQDLGIDYTVYVYISCRSLIDPSKSFLSPLHLLVQKSTGYLLLCGFYRYGPRQALKLALKACL